MAAHDHPPYRFDGYLEALGEDWLDDDPLLRRWLARSAPDAPARALVERFGRLAAGRFRASAEIVERRENLPRLEEADPYDRRVREVFIPEETRAALALVHGSGIWRAATDERVRYALVYLLNENGEFGVTCSTACTDGLARILRRHGEDARSREVVDELEGATPERFVHGAQFVTEIQGGSDAATNQLRAEAAGDGLFALSGPKWFCSNCTAEYWLVTARPEGSAPGHRGVGLFCVPRSLAGRPNGHRLLRLKDKLGTRALPTAEIEFEGALGWPVGPLDAGLRNMVATVLVTSRIHNVVAAAAATRRAVREAVAYARFREAFGRKLADHPLLASSLRGLADHADRAEAGAFATVDAWIAGMAPDADELARIWARVLVSVAKAVGTRESPGRIYEAMMVFGGNGIEERFCALPRLWRDAAIMETWEGPYTLLLMQALGDLVRLGVAGREEALLAHGLGDATDPEDVEALAAILEDPTSEAGILRWRSLAHGLYHRFQERALAGLR
jgi:alkylation response protein AidB-like acyl-CoA dehydrogenase